MECNHKWVKIRDFEKHGIEEYLCPWCSLVKTTRVTLPKSSEEEKDGNSPRVVR